MANDTEDKARAAAVPPGQPTALNHDAGASLIASASAPFVFFDIATLSGVNGAGTAHITLEAVRHMTHNDTAFKDFVTVCHLRCDLGGLSTLKRAIERIELLLQPGPTETRN